jgi:hypothetical protein
MQPAQLWSAIGRVPFIEDQPAEIRVPPVGSLPAAIQLAGGMLGRGVSSQIVSRGRSRSQCAAGSRRSGTSTATLKIATLSARWQNFST